MCGLFASVGFPPDPQHIDIVSHRGPDGRGWKVMDSRQGPVALGHRRLSIIDLEDRSLQPMSCPDGRYWMVFNGEIYNYIELRSQLRRLGRTFRTESDSEVLLQGYAEWGPPVLDKLMGMFAVIIWDSKSQRLFAARDRFGIKPLYVHAGARGIAFASEIKQLLDLPGVSRRAEPSRVWDFITSGITDHSAETMFADVQHIRPGCCLTLDLSSWCFGQSLPVRRYYRADAITKVEMSRQEAASRFRELLEDSVRLHLRSDVPVGSCLSGGLDSSAIVSLMRRRLDATKDTAQIHTVSACFPNKEVDEKPFMEHVVRASRTTPHYIFPEPEDALERAAQLTWHQDEPFGSTSIFAQWCVFEEARARGIKVMLDGQGADEQLAGYHGGFSIQVPALIRQRRWAELARLMWERKKWHGVPVSTHLSTYLSPKLRKFLPQTAPAQQLATYPWWDSQFYRTHMPPAGATFGDAIQREGLGQVDNLGTLCIALTAVTNLPMLLRFEDRNSMAHSIEARVPFLDHRLVELSLALWDQHKIVGGDTKKVLRDSMAGILPDAIRFRRDKLGFATPEQAWFRGPLRPMIEKLMEETLANYPGLVDADQLRPLAKEMLDGTRPMDNTIWRVVNFGIWGRTFGMTLDGVASRAPVAAFASKAAEKSRVEAIAS